MPETIPGFEEVESIDLKKWVLPVAAGVLCACLGVWIGFKIAGGSVAELDPSKRPVCADCEERRILEGDSLA